MWLTTSRVESTVAEVVRDFSDLPVSAEKITAEIVGRHQELVTRLRPTMDALDKAEAERLRAEEAARRFGRVIKRFTAAVVVLGGLLILLSIKSLTRWDWPFGYVDFTAVFRGLKHSGAAWLAFGIGAGLGVFALAAESVLKRIGLLPELVRTAALVAADARAELAAALLTEAESFVTETINRYEQAEVSTGDFIRAVQARALVELDSPDTMPTEGLDAAVEYLTNYETSAVGIAGPRGIGKSTIIRRLARSDEDSIGVYIQAPVYYEASDFIRLIHAEVAEGILSAHFGGLRIVWRKTSPATFRLFSSVGAFAAGGLVVAGVVTDFTPVTDLSTSLGVLGVAGLLLMAVGAVGIVQAYLTVVLPALVRSVRRSPRSNEAIRRLAQEEIHRLQWNSSLQSKNKLSMNILPNLKTEAEDQVALGHRERSHPERVADLRGFLLRYREMSGSRKIVIAIDELDKIASAEQALQVVNGLKDLFHIRDSHFFVSVSEDALDSFALRGVPVRDAFDSSFDAIIRVRPFTAADSRAMLLRRVRGFPPAAALLCHTVSGGLPRDLIRAARRSVTFRRAQDDPLPVSDLAGRLVQAESLDAIEAAIRRYSKSGRARGLYAMRQHVERYDGDIAELTGRLTTWLSEADGEDAEADEKLPPDTMRIPIVVLLLQLATVRDFFAVRRTSEEWREIVEQDWLAGGVEELARAKTELAVSPVESMQHVVNARARLRLTPVPPDALIHTGLTEELEPAHRVHPLRAAVTAVAKAVRIARD